MTPGIKKKVPPAIIRESFPLHRFNTRSYNDPISVNFYVRRDDSRRIFSGSFSSFEWVSDVSAFTPHKCPECSNNNVFNTQEAWFIENKK